MINKKENPVEWALMMYELEETEEHLSDLMKVLQSKEAIDEPDFKVQISHIYTHLNRIYNSRNHVGEITDKDSYKYSYFPKDIKPVG